MEFHSSTVAAEAGDDASGVPDGRLEMPEDGSTEVVSGKGLTCTVGGLKVGYRYIYIVFIVLCQAFPRGPLPTNQLQKKRDS